MTALSVALVLCCAMVCGTRLVLARRAERGQDVALLAQQAASLAEAVALTGSEVSRLREELNTLKAQSAFRSLG